MPYGWRPYVPVAQRRAQGTRFAQQLAKKEGREVCPVRNVGRTISTTFWGKAWCENLEQYSDFENRLPRGRTYVRNGSIVDLVIQPGSVRAFVSGSDVYQVRIDITRLKPAAWKCIKGDCSASIDSLLDLLAGRFSDGVMARLTEPKKGLFPQPAEIKINCSCPDWAVLCKHAAAVLYGVGARLDEQPELLFLLRDVDHHELAAQAVTQENLDEALAGQSSGLGGENLSELFGVDIDSATAGEDGAEKKPARMNGRAKTGRGGKTSGSPQAGVKTTRRRSKKKSAARAEETASGKTSKKTARTKASPRATAKKTRRKAAAKKRASDKPSRSKAGAPRKKK